MMPSRDPLSDDAIQAALADLDGWEHDDDALEKTYTLADFRAAIGFIVRLSFEAEELNHHPELENVYNTVEIGLTTHDAGNVVTEVDLELARRIEAIAAA
jgi:4a-hydroxytetrahydrobiopterin dehydratase